MIPVLENAEGGFYGEKSRKNFQLTAPGFSGGQILGCIIRGFGVGTLLDPSLTKADGLTGNIAGKSEMLPPTVSELTIESFLFTKAVGTKELMEITKIQVGESLLLDVGTSITAGSVTSIRGEKATLKLSRPVSAEKGARTALSRKIAGRWRLIGYGIVT
jgi:translation initiation factor 2 subunit 3